jgi:SUKH superfamily protein
MWKKLLKELKVSELGRPPLALPTDDTLNQFQIHSGFKLSTSYREYAKLFGVGELAGYYRIAVPLAVESEYDLAKFNKITKGSDEEKLWDGYTQPEALQQLFFFAATIGGEMFAWKLDEITDKKRNEYAIYFLPRVPPMVFSAQSYSSFVQDICLGEENAAGESCPRQFIRY